MTDDIILGIDPAIASIGFGAIQGETVLDYGVITTAATLPVWQRLRQIDADIQELCRMFQPTLVGIEMPFFSREITSAGKVLKALGVIELAIGKALGQAPIFLHQSQVKAAVAQYGAGKADIQQSVMFLFKLSELPKPDDAADGLAIAYAVQTGVRSKIT